MTVGQIFGIAITVMGSMQKNGLLDTNGNLVKLATIALELDAASAVVADVEPVLKAAGVAVPAEAEKIILALPAMIAMTT